MRSFTPQEHLIILKHLKEGKSYSSVRKMIRVTDAILFREGKRDPIVREIRAVFEIRGRHNKQKPKEQLFKK